MSVLPGGFELKIYLLDIVVFGLHKYTVKIRNIVYNIMFIQLIICITCINITIFKKTRFVNLIH